MRKNMGLGIMILLGVWCLLYVGIKIDMWRLGYELENLENKRVVLKREQEILQVQWSRLTDPQRIARRAHDQLGLIVPQEGQIVMVSLDTMPSSDSERDSSMQLVREFSDNLLDLP